MGGREGSGAEEVGGKRKSLKCLCLLFSLGWSVFPFPMGAGPPAGGDSALGSQVGVTVLGCHLSTPQWVGKEDLGSMPTAGVCVGWGGDGDGVIEVFGCLWPQWMLAASWPG